MAIDGAHIPEGAIIQMIRKSFRNELLYVDFIRHVRQ